MKKSIWEKRIPTLLGMFLISIGIVVTTLLVRQGGLLPIKATPIPDPKDIRISNITDNSFNVSYFTDENTTGLINYGNNPSLGQSMLDDKDQLSGSVGNHRIHNITVKNIEPEKKYYFSITSNGKTYTNNGKPFEITTGKKITKNLIDQSPISGKVIVMTGVAPKEAIVYLTTQNAQVISTMVKADGTFKLNLNSLRNSSLNSYYKIEDGAILKILVVGDGLKSNVTLSKENINPVPNITLSNDYDYTTTTVPISPSSTNTNTFPEFKGSATELETPQILIPQKDQNFTDTKPQFKGTAQPNTEVTITIHSNENIKITVTSNSNGNWIFRPSSSLSAGKHTITIAAKNTAGITETITQSFVVFASEGQTLTSTLSPTRTPTPTATPVPSVTLIAQATFTPTQTPTITISETLTPTTAIPPTGNPTMITAGIIGLLISLIGGLLFLLTRGTIK